MSDRVAALKAELAMAELEAAFAEAKNSPEGPSRELKDQLREARRDFRENHRTAPDGEGDAVAQPAAIEATAQALSPGDA